jgi:hypothetical protein
LEQQGVEQGHVDVLALAGGVAVVEGGQRAQRGVDAGQIVGQVGRGLGRRR